MSPFLDVISFFFGLLILFFAFLRGITDRQLRHDLKSKTKQEEIQAASHELWALDESAGLDLPYQHHFLTLSDAVKLHYFTPRNAGGTYKKLVIFLHGFPDSSALFLPYLTRPSPSKKETGEVLRLSLDLPGCGGSDNIHHYGADTMLGAVLESIVELKKRYLGSDAEKQGQCILVAHDWGGVIGSRLAAESVGVIDGLVLVNSVHLIRHSFFNMRLCGKRALHSLSLFTKEPLNLSHLSRAVHAVVPVVNQMWKSKYIHLLRLPLPKQVFTAFHEFWVSVSLKECHDWIEVDPSSPHSPRALNMATSCGPNLADCGTRATDGQTYGPSVRLRATTIPPGDWDERVRLYKEECFISKWRTLPDKHVPPPIKAVKDGRVPEQYSFQCPVQVVFATNDLAFDPRIVVDNIDHFFAAEKNGSKKSKVVIVEGAGHWALAGKKGKEAVEKSIQEML